MDWSGCEWVERVEGRCAGAPTVVGTRVFPEAVVGSHQLGESVEEIHENFPTVSVEIIRGLIRYAEKRQVQAAA